MVSWTDLPYEVQQIIVVELVGSLDTIHHLTDILLLSKNVHDSLLGSLERGVETHDDLYLLIFQKMFDAEAPKRRLGHECLLTPNIFASVLKRRCKLLKEVRSGVWVERILGNANWGEYRLEDTLWEIYLMLLDDDGKNMVQLECAHVEDFLRRVILLLVERELDDSGWPLESVFLQLAVASFAIVSDRASVLREDEETTERMCGALETIVMGSHRYGHTHLPITLLTAQQINNIPVVPPDSLRTVATMPISPYISIDYFGHELTLSPPPVAPSAFLIITNRREKLPIGVLPNTPATRAEAIARGWEGATAADWRELNTLRAMAIGVETPRAGSERENLSGLISPLRGSARWDHTFNRMRAVADALIYKSVPLMHTWFNTLYRPGMFTGNWLGRIALPDFQMIQRMADLHPATLATVRDTLPEHTHYMWTVFFHANLREHVTADTPVGTDYMNVDGGVQNAYFPIGVDPAIRRNFRSHGNSILIDDPMEPDPHYSQKRYQTWDEEMEVPVSIPMPRPQRVAPMSRQMQWQLQDVDSQSDMDADESGVDVPEDVEMDFEEEGVGEEVPTLDVVITGETDYLHGSAWGHYTYYGRVRKLDGLIVLVRVSPSDQNQGRWIFAGNMMQAGTIVGTWRTPGPSIDSIVLQGPFIISKVGPEISIIDSPVSSPPV